MKALEIISVSVLAALALTLTACSGNGAFPTGASPASDKTQVLALLTRQRDLMRQRDWRELYQTYTPRFQADCPYNRFLEGVPSQTGVDLSKLDFDKPSVRLAEDGNTAYVTYIITYKGEDRQAVVDDDPDIFVKIDGTWYDEEDSHTQC